MEQLQQIWNLEFQGITLADFVILTSILLIAFVVRKIFQSIIVGRLRKLADRTTTDIDDHLINALEQPIAFLILLAGLYLAFLVIGLPIEPVNIRRFFRTLIKIMVTVDFAWLFIRLTDVMAIFLQKMTHKTDSTLDDQLVPLVRKSIKVAFGILAFVVIVQNLGYQVTGLLAGLGIGGLAFALAAQSTLSNLFGSITIILDRPFRVGELISGDGFRGVVEEIGLRSTRIRTLEKTLVTVPNSKMADMTVDNLTQRPYRRAKFVVGVTYETDAASMEQALEAVRGILTGREDVVQNKILVRFTEFNDSSLDILVQFLTARLAWSEYLTVREEVNLEIMRVLAGMNIEVAFPTSTVYLKNEENAG